MSVPVLVGVLLGGLLILAGLVWIFVEHFGRRGRSEKMRASAADLSIIERLLNMLREWSASVFRQEELAGAWLIIAGIVLIVASLGLGDL